MCLCFPVVLRRHTANTLSQRRHMIAKKLIFFTLEQICDRGPSAGVLYLIGYYNDIAWQLFCGYFIIIVVVVVTRRILHCV